MGDLSGSPDRVGGTRVVADGPAFGLLVVGTGAALGGLVVPGAADWFWSAAGLAALGVAGDGLVRMPRRSRDPWVLLWLAMFFVAVAVVVRGVHLDGGERDQGLSPVGAGFAALACVLGLAGICRLAARRWPRGEERLTVCLDAGIAATAVLIPMWTFLLEPVLRVRQPSVALTVLALCLPVVPVLEATVAGQAAFGGGRALLTRSAVVLTLGLLALVGATWMELFQSRFPDSSLARATPAVFALGLVWMGAAFRMGSTAVLTSPVDSPPEGSYRARILVIGLACVGVPAVTLLGAPSTRSSLYVLSALQALMIGLVVLQIWRAGRQQVRAEHELVAVASHDALTGLWNRTRLMARAEQLLGEGGSGGGSHACVVVDIDRFQFVNDTLGHEFGDLLLCEVAGRLRGRLRPGELLGHLGSDQFVVIARLEPGNPVVAWADRWRLALEAPITVADHTLHLSVSAGVAEESGERGFSAQRLWREADTALNSAKRSGTRKAVQFDPSMRDRVTARHELERELRLALSRRELSVAYQPIVSAGDRRVVAFEALVRWTHPLLGRVGPDRFIPVAEETGMIMEIGAWVWATAVAQLARWQRSVPGGANLRMAVNASALQFSEPAFLEFLSNTQDLGRVSPNTVSLELTESVLADEEAHLREAFARVRQLGIGLSIDDFGTRYSALSYLHRVPATTLKIDRSFVRQLDDPDQPSDMMVKIFMTLAESYGMCTVAEGVETEEQARRLEELGCDYLQGYLFSPALPAASIPEFCAELGAGDRPRALGAVG